MEEFKQVIIVRKDLGMSKGKTAVQVAHASVLAAFEAYNKKTEWFKSWFESGQKKIVLKVDSEEELLKYYNEAVKSNLPVAIVRDAGLTELPPGTVTAIAIGPAPGKLIDRFTSELKTL
ncbi:MAG: peptidyl-tRNA hydrolase Pth2 [Desulfurococcaceae archaeon]